MAEEVFIDNPDYHHHHVEDKTPEEIAESAYRRGFHQALFTAHEFINQGGRPAEFIAWEKRVEGWRYRLPPFDQPRGVIVRPPLPKR